MSKKILITKIGLDGHDVGAKFIANFLKENGFNVKYLGIRTEIDKIIDTAKKFKPDVIGVSIMTGAHIFYSKKLKEALRKNSIKAKLVFGGLIPEEDKKVLLKNVDMVFSNRDSISSIINYLKKI